MERVDAQPALFAGTANYVGWGRFITLYSTGG
jgi:hypothetical protein